MDFLYPLALMAALKVTTPGVYTDYAPDQVANWAYDTYGPEIEFTVHRKGKKIGSHKVDLTKKDGTITIASKTRLRVKVLFITAFKLDYLAVETWNNEGLNKVYSKTNQQGKKTEFDKPFDQLQAPIASNHWNPYVKTVKAVYNPVTGKPMDITLTYQGDETVETWNGSVQARRYDYDWELTETSVWYDDQGRWVAMSFKGGDGSTINYKCKKCGLDRSS